MKKTNYIFLTFGVVVLLFSSCAHKKWELVRYTTDTIQIDASKDKLADSAMNALIIPYKKQLDKKMNVVIGKSAVEMTKGRPESLLSNWNAELYRVLCSQSLKKQVDMSVLNMGGLRAELPKGNITVRNVYQLMPFENELVILWLKGSQIKELFQIFAKEGGQGIAGASFEIKNKKAQNCKIGGKKINDNQLYSIATSDYLAAGNDRMVTLAEAQKRVDTHIMLRDAILEYIVDQTKKGKVLHPKLDKRIINLDKK